jgi:hypothetical protein
MSIFLGNYRAYRRQKTMTNKELDVVEIYPKIFVYKNLFKDINKTFSLLRDSDGGDDGLFSPWTQWSYFGDYLYPTFKDMRHILTTEYIEEIETKTQKQEEQKQAILELVQNFYIATQDYILKNNVEFDMENTVLNEKGESLTEWRINGPSITRYREDIDKPIAMTYHSDYVREPIISPGYKFAITALAYFNDDYEGGEIDFIVDGEACMYKPEAGDYLVFPSGNPDILTQNGSIYIHGVLPSRNTKKYLSRMYWMKYYPGDDEWFEKEKEFGKEVWAEMQEEIMQQFRHDHPNRADAKGVKRVR